MTLLEMILKEYPELTIDNFTDGTIVLQNDSNDKGDYIKEWNYSNPLTDNLKAFYDK